MSEQDLLADCVKDDLAAALEQAQQNNRELNELLTIRTKQAAGAILRQQRIEQLEAALIEPDNGQIRCLACKRQTYMYQEILHKEDCPLFAGDCGKVPPKPECPPNIVFKETDVDVFVENSDGDSQ